jgi:hypothetical protein
MRLTSQGMRLMLGIEWCPEKVESILERRWIASSTWRLSWSTEEDVPNGDDEQILHGRYNFSRCIVEVQLCDEGSQPLA